MSSHAEDDQKDTGITDTIWAGRYLTKGEEAELRTTFLDFAATRGHVPDRGREDWNEFIESLPKTLRPLTTEDAPYLAKLKAAKSHITRRDGRFEQDEPTFRQTGCRESSIPRSYRQSSGADTHTSSFRGDDRRHYRHDKASSARHYGSSPHRRERYEPRRPRQQRSGRTRGITGRSYREGHERERARSKRSDHKQTERSYSSQRDRRSASPSDRSRERSPLRSPNPFAQTSSAKDGHYTPPNQPFAGAGQPFWAGAASHPNISARTSAGRAFVDPLGTSSYGVGAPPPEPQAYPGMQYVPSRSGGHAWYGQADHRAYTSYSAGGSQVPGGPMPGAFAQAPEGFPPSARHPFNVPFRAKPGGDNGYQSHTGNAPGVPVSPEVAAEVDGDEEGVSDDEKSGDEVQDNNDDEYEDTDEEEENGSGDESEDPGLANEPHSESVVAGRAKGGAATGDSDVDDRDADVADTSGGENWELRRQRLRNDARDQRYMLIPDSGPLGEESQPPSSSISGPPSSKRSEHDKDEWVPHSPGRQYARYMGYPEKQFYDIVRLPDYGKVTYKGFSNRMSGILSDDLARSTSLEMWRERLDQLSSACEQATRWFGKKHMTGDLLKRYKQSRRQDTMDRMLREVKAKHDELVDGIFSSDATDDQKLGVLRNHYMKQVDSSRTGGSRPRRTQR